jgi:hypothetical protein
MEGKSKNRCFFLSILQESLKKEGDADEKRRSKEGEANE